MTVLMSSYLFHNLFPYFATIQRFCIFLYIFNIYVYCAFQERKGTAKLDFLRKIELDTQQKWEKDKVFECDAPVTTAK